MFQAHVYTNRRNKLKSLVNSGILLFIGNQEASYNYLANTYHFRQDSNFLYFFGLDLYNLVGLIDLDEKKEFIFGNDVDMDDIIWMGPQPSIAEQAKQVGIENTTDLSALAQYITKAQEHGRKIHISPTYRNTHLIQLADLFGVSHKEVKNFVSVELIKAIVSLREIKEEIEIEEIEKAMDIAYDMHTTSMRMAYPGRVEREIAGTIEGISLAKGSAVSFPIILSVQGETLHNHYHGNVLQVGQMMVTDAGAETTMHYASDITRTVPVGGKFNERQKGIYQAVLDANMSAIEAIRPGIEYRDIHFLAAKVLVEGLIKVGLMKGDAAAAVQAEAHTLFMPHGLGHQMGLDVHDMESLGENFVGYDENTKRATTFGTAYLRMGKEMKAGIVLTVEPGCYFIPALIDLWKSENKNAEFINYGLLESYKDFGGIRIEDDILVTETSHRVLGKPIPKTIDDIEATMANKI